MCSDETIIESYSIALTKRIDEIWIDFRHFLGNRKANRSFISK
jgi:hypothetical protein